MRRRGKDSSHHLKDRYASILSNGLGTMTYLPKLVQLAILTSSLVVIILTSNIWGAQNGLNKLEQSPSQSSGNDEIRLTVTVSNKRFGLVEGLTQQSFTIFDNKAPQQISSFSTEDVPISVGILFDTSDSVRGRTNYIKKGLSSFIEASNKAN